MQVTGSGYRDTGGTFTLLHSVTFAPDAIDVTFPSIRPLPREDAVGVRVGKIGVDVLVGVCTCVVGLEVSVGKGVCASLDASTVSVAAIAFSSATRVPMRSGVYVGAIVGASDDTSQAIIKREKTTSDNPDARRFIALHLSTISARSAPLLVKRHGV